MSREIRDLHIRADGKSHNAFKIVSFTLHKKVHLECAFLQSKVDLLYVEYIHVYIYISDVTFAFFVLQVFLMFQCMTCFNS